MGAPRDEHAKESKSEENKHMISLICGILNKMKLIYKMEIDSQT